MDEKKPPASLQIAIKAEDEVQSGSFSNVARISHGPESFNLDFLVVHPDPPFGRLVARVILTPGHAKRFLRALTENVERYERSHGEIPAPESAAPDGYVQ